MSSVPAGKRVWNCPDCGGEVLLSVTQLDPLACPACVAKLKGGSSPTSAGSEATGGTVDPLQIVMAQPMSLKLAAIGIASLLIGLLLGLSIGFFAGRATAPQSTAPSRGSASPDSPSSRSTARARELDTEPTVEVEVGRPDESTRPGPGYKWVKSYTRKDGVKVKGHWARDSNARK